MAAGQLRAVSYTHLVYVKGPGAGREAAIRALQAVGLEDVYKRQGLGYYNNPLTDEMKASMSETQIAAYENAALAPWMVPVISIGMLALVVFIVFISNAERRLPVQYAKRVVGRKMYGGQSTHIPIKVNMSGVMPIIFAQSLASLPATIGAFAGWTTCLLYTSRCV